MTNSKNQELLEIREYAIKSLREELLGPGSERGSVQSSGSEEDSTNIRNALTSSVEEEKISERPEQRYILGVLHPQEDADLSEDDCVSSASRFDDSISSSGGFKPSSMGLCFVVTRLPEKLKFIFSAGLYTEEKSDITQRKFFSRYPFSKTLEIEVGKDEPLNQAENINNSRYEFDFYLKAYEIKEGQVFCTLMVVNRSDKCVFQPKLEIRREENDFDFISLNRILNNASTEEEKSLELLYREKENFGSGLGVSVSWKKNEFGVESIYTEFLPTVEVPNVSFDIPDDLEISKDVLSMRYLSGLDCEDYSPRLKEIEKFLDGYDKWITEQEQRISSLEDFHQEAASRNIVGCKKALLRMKRGLELLNGDYLVRKAFQLANRGMLIQRVRLQQQKEDSVAPAILELDNSAVEIHRWRAFQLAFLLMSLNAAVNPNSEDRELVDLIWFPTGGGKTEAYLGVIAFYIVLRRLQNPEFGGGTAAIMRYTLRSLSSQQFSRASTLMCALEYMRKKMREDGDLSLGSSEISIGLWVGRQQTPNNVKEAL
jgi:helicase domain protein